MRLDLSSNGFMFREDQLAGGGEAPDVPAGVLTNPPVSARLGVFGQPSAFPFVNMFKSAWSWSTTGFGDYDALLAAGHINARGDLISIPPTGDQNIVTRVLPDMVAESGATGRWRFTFTGESTFAVFGGSNHDQVDANTFEFDYVANGSSWVTIVFWTIENGPISNFKLVHEDDWALDAAGEIFRPAYLDEVYNYRVLRFDDWGGILDGGLTITDWDTRGHPNDAMFVHYAPYEWMAALCNKVGADMWVCMPTAATDDYMAQAAELIRSLMPSPRHIYVEYSTKTWDFSGTPQAHYCAEQGRLAFGTDTGQEFLNWYGLRSAEMAQIWRGVWGAEPRLHVVIQTQCDWLGNEDGVLNAPQWRDNSKPFLNDPAAVARGVTLNSVTGNSISVTTNDTDTRRAYSLPIPPSGARLRFDVTTTGRFYLRLATDTGLGPTGIVELIPGSLLAGTHSVDVIIPAYDVGTVVLGFFHTASGVNTQISNWRITMNDQSPYVPPHSVCDMLTVHAQVDGGMAYGGRAADLETWRTTLTQTEAFNRIRDQMLTGVWFDPTDINQRNITRLTPKWDYFRNIADTYDLQLGCYEVGNHLNGVGGGEDLVAFMHEFSRSTQIAEVYTATFEAILDAGFDGPLCMSVDIKYPDWNTMHGLQHWAGDHNPPWAAVNAINQVNDGPAGRGATDFVGNYPEA